ncbi:putative triglyceride lipase-cholesterol esterase [Cryphonectria parasitica EP155]|uniref:Triglyceride lipase-cholesterol esterase n=1 Tax=Cryphonectria parasitica (strain ATCC 38755 / EP155) TaxID=660469 RepID=A0A9P4Y1V6_CRYP1|nr:putative triglyceride lipase-cholesterol esterase [Cryphonectria parasitica EP155]KAF3765133.1 putative triglyceride lipase-cholesterol esterase [Cryphonectria parasitica EP155]
MPVPFIGRLNIVEYVAVALSFAFVTLESIIRVLTFALPSPLINIFYRASRRIFNRWRSTDEKRAEERKKSLSTAIRNATDFVELCELFGYTAEEHVVQTSDGYLLGLHRLAWRKDEEDLKVNSGPNSIKKRVIYLHHGLLMNSEVWVCLTDAERALPFVLVDKGFDVWLGNNRGNKYSKKSVNSAPTSLEFWNFSIDEFAFYDIPNSIEYILGNTGQPSLSYIGFSQGTAQAFAALSIHPKLNQQVNVFIALAPAMSPPGLANGIADALIKASPQVLFLMFGRRGILSSAPLWESIIYPPLYIKIIDNGIRFLFNWKAQNISVAQKLAAYPHLYSFTSTKSVVHWFQIIRTKSFQMYDDDPPLSIGTSTRSTKVTKYPTRNIKTPVVLVYGGSDSLVDIKAMLRELPPKTVATEIPHYEHLDFLWARDVAAQVFPHVFDALDSFTNAEHSKDEYDSYRRARTQSLGKSATFWQRGHAYNGSDMNDSDVNSAVGGTPSTRQAHQAREGIRDVRFSDDDISTITDPSERGADSPHPLGRRGRTSPPRGLGLGLDGSAEQLDGDKR